MDCYTKSVIISVIVLSLICPSQSRNVMKRNLGQFAYEMVHYCGWVQGYELMDYGCYCGKGGYGEPMDNLDRCCKAHDDCYGELESKHYYADWYKYKFKKNTIECDDDFGTDHRKLCECDKIILECVLRSEYHSENHKNCSADKK